MSAGFPAFAPKLASECVGFREGYFGELALLEERNFWFRARNFLILWAMDKYFPDCRSFLEIGCGTGFVLNGVYSKYPSMRLFGSEIFTAGLKFAAKRVPSAQLYQMDARKIPFREEFDLIGAFDVLEHIDEDEAVIAEASKALRPGGGLLLSVPQHRSLWSRQDEYACHVRRYDPGELRARVERAGFEVATEVSFVSILMPLLWMSRRLKRRSTTAFDPFDELRLNNVTNMILEKVMSLERTLIMSGFRSSVGGSLLLAARKKG